MLQGARRLADDPSHKMCDVSKILALPTDTDIVLGKTSPSNYSQCSLCLLVHSFSVVHLVYYLDE